MRKRKILIVQNELANYRIPVFTHLNKYYDLTVLHMKGNVYNEEFKTIKFKGLQYHIKGFHFTPGVGKIAKAFDVIILPFDLWWFNLVLLPVRLRRKSFIFWGHGLGRTNSSSLSVTIRKMLSKSVNALLFYSKETKRQFIQKTHVKEEKCFVAANTVEVSNAGVDLLTKKKYFLYLGRLQERKGLDVFLKAYALLEPEMKEEYSVLLVGESQLDFKETLLRLSEELNISKYVQFENGTYDPEKVKEYFTSALAYVSPNHVGLGVVHSLAFGIPVITQSDEAIHAPEFTYCNTGNSYLYEVTGNSTHEIVLAENLKLAMSDEKLYQSKSKEAFNTYAENCTLDNMVLGFAEAIEYSAG